MSAKDIDSVPLPYSKPPISLLSKGKRHDGRQPEEFRQIFLRLGLNSRAAGSGYAEFNNTKVMCAVYGPRESDRREPLMEQGRLNCDIRFARFAGPVRAAVPESGKEREMSGLLERALEPAVLLHTFPKMFVDVYCLVVEADGGELPTAIIAASLALADAGIALRDLVPACTVVRVQQQLLTDPDREEFERADASLTLAVLPSLNLVSGLVMLGQWTLVQMQQALDCANANCQRLDEVMRETLREAMLEPMDPG
eukprot:jgi/Botrbrau1/4191/Bobra.0192s0050.1